MSTTTDVSKQTLRDLKEFLRQYCREDIATLASFYPREQRSLYVSFEDVLAFDPSIADDFLDSPDKFTEGLEEALKQIDLPVKNELFRAHVRVTGLNDAREFGVGEYATSDIGEYLAIEGQVAKVSDSKPELETAVYQCKRCGHTFPVEQYGDDLVEPEQCRGCERQGPFEVSYDDSEFVDHKVIRIQEPPEKTQGGQGSSIDVHLRDDLATGLRGSSDFSAGDRITVTGQYSVGIPDSGRDFEEFVEAHAVTVEQTDFEEIDVEEYEEEIHAIAAGERGDPIELFVDSLAPKIQGYETIKEAVILQLFGGVRVEYPDDSIERGDSHILLLGDPGTAKSSLLRAVEEIAPRSTYASGKGATASGLTAAAVPDDFGDTKWSLEAGALVLANKGIACVDEIDKIEDSAVQSMHEALEDQRVPVNKAGINTILPAQTSLLAAGNPRYGRFDQHESIAGQIELGPTLLSRFDLMFMLSDQADADEDREIIDSMIENRRTAVRHMTSGDADEDALEEITPAIDPELMRAYVAFSKQNVTPRIKDDQVSEHLKTFLAELRQANSRDEDGPVPVTFRKLEAIERLAEASARARLSSEVTIEDAQRATRLVTRSMRDVGVDPDTGDFDADIVETGTSKAQRDRIKTLKSIIREEDGGNGADVETVLSTMVEEGFGKSQTQGTIEKLKDDYQIFEPSGCEGALKLS